MKNLVVFIGYFYESKACESKQTRQLSQLYSDVLTKVTIFDPINLPFD